MISVAATVKKMIQESEIQVSVCVENVCPCLRMRKACCRDTNEIPDDYFEGNHNT